MIKITKGREAPILELPMSRCTNYSREHKDFTYSTNVNVDVKIPLSVLAFAISVISEVHEAKTVDELTQARYRHAEKPKNIDQEMSDALHPYLSGDAKEGTERLIEKLSQFGNLDIALETIIRLLKQGIKYE